MRLLMLVLFLVCSINVVEAARPRYYSNSQPNNKTYSYTVHQGNSHQERCQAEANNMAANNITGHVWGTIGSFEGVGYGSGPNCNTCVPSNNMRLTGDASAQGRNGMWFRVRSWR